ncbi:MAG: hypothetical protein ACPL1F_00095 [bacterium]|jgi:hypothetical protein
MSLLFNAIEEFKQDIENILQNYRKGHKIYYSLDLPENTVNSYNSSILYIENIEIFYNNNQIQIKIPVSLTYFYLPKTSDLTKDLLNLTNDLTLNYSQKILNNCVVLFKGVNINPDIEGYLIEMIFEIIVITRR